MSKVEWPELVGMTWQEAQERIRKEYLHVMVQVLPISSMVNMDFNENRVRVYIDEKMKVTKPPKIG